MINLGIYLKDLADAQWIDVLQSEIVRAKKDNQLSDVSIFYDNIGPVQMKVDAGFFNSTDIWNFNGDLITTCLETLIKSTNSVNNMNTYYCFGYGAYDVLSMLRTLNTKKIPTIALDEDSARNFYRITNIKPISVNSNFTGVVQTIMEHKNGRN